MIANRSKLLFAGFLTLIAAGMGFAVRGGLLRIWSEKYGFTSTELGQITGGGLLGFGLVILVAGFLIDMVGYKRLMLLALLGHVASAVMLFFATPVFESAGKDATYQILFWSAFVFAVGNGICEAVINPLTATLYPEEKTHYLNILHAGWPGGLVLGGLTVLLADRIPWELLLASYLVPAAIYGVIAFMEPFPKTVAQSGEISYAGMLHDCMVPFFFLLVFTHALVGYVELGTDSWINKITGSILADPMKGTLLFIYTSILMFTLRFFAGTLVHRLSSLGLLFWSAIIGASGLYLISKAEGLWAMVVAVTTYAVGKTFLWPTMLGVAGERFPRSATLTMAILGFAGMSSAGLFGGPGIGYKQDRFAAQKLQQLSPETYARYEAENENQFLWFAKIRGLDGAKVGVVTDIGADGQRGAGLSADKQIAMNAHAWEQDKYASLRKLDAWWQTAQSQADQDSQRVSEAGLYGSRMALRITALIPVTMAALYFIMMFGFRKPA